jgi:hypothetical protein
MATRPDRVGRGHSGLHLALTVAALLVTVYLAFQVIGFLVRFALLVAAGLIAFAAYRAWERSP